MSYQIQFRRGLKKDLPLLATGEVGYANDTKELFIGSPTGNERLTFDDTKHKDLEASINSVAGINIKYPPSPLLAAKGVSKSATGYILNTYLNRFYTSKTSNFNVGDKVVIDGGYKEERWLTFTAPSYETGVDGTMTITTPDGISVTAQFTKGLTATGVAVAFQAKASEFVGWTVTRSSGILILTSTTYGDKGSFTFNGGGTGVTVNMTTGSKEGSVIKFSTTVTGVSASYLTLNINSPGIVDSSTKIYIDDTDAILALISYANGNELFVPKEDFYVTQDIDITKLNGEGRLLKDGIYTDVPNKIRDLTEQLAHTTTDLNQRGESFIPFDVIADGSVDTTTALQSYINYCQTNNLLMSLNGTFLTSGITFGANARVVGNATFKPINDNQPFVVKATAKIIWQGKLHIDGLTLALNGFLGSNFIASHFAEVEVRNCKKWGFTFERSGNNSLVQVEYFRGGTNGTKHKTDFTVNSVVTGAHKTVQITLTTPLASHYYSDLYDVMFVIYNGRPYKVVQFLSSTILEVYNLPLVATNTGSLDIIIGGALNIQSYGDNGVGNWGVVDAFGNSGVGLNMSALYGHTFGRLVLQGNSIGIGCSDISLGVTFNAPYFELNTCEIVVWNYIDGTMFNPIIQYNKIFSLVQHNLYGIDYHPRLNIIADKKISNMSNEQMLVNAPSRTLYPSNIYALNYTTSPSDRIFTIANDVVYKNSISSFLNIHFKVVGSMKVTFKLSDNTKETIEGSTEYTDYCNGDTHYLFYLNTNNEWKVLKFQNDLERSTVPTSGSYKADQYVKKSGRVETGTAGSKYIVKGWIRLTTGSTHVLGTDWVEDRALTGN